MFLATLQRVSVCYHSVYYCLICYSVTGYALLNALQTAANDFGAMFKNQHALIANVTCLNSHNVCATGVSNGLSARVTLTPVLQSLWESLVRRGYPFLISVLCHRVALYFKWHISIIICIAFCVYLNLKYAFVSWCKWVWFVIKDT